MDSTAYSNVFATAMLAEVRRRLFGESFPRIRQCVERLQDEEIWRSPNPVSNSVGNLVLHICGNTTQWLISGLGEQPDKRNRSEEFEKGHRLSSKALLELLEEVEGKAEKVLDQIKAEHLLQTYAVQAFRETGLSMLVHVVEHTSYHTGQITYMTKWVTERETNYYGDLSLEEKNKGPV